ncbi:MAG: tryptophan-rich sensory protein [Clostridia bacterium]|jgi:tryptophan-rich sensory protein|nr:tryptophan-rich sensory protein [Clostridia bacterium]MCI2000240.1 tryptophan-rich sensory protein [Clostridia bacterium]MCI2014595.1 tryptophan-rich sensory protein [Clostridia bacterium]
MKKDIDYKKLIWYIFLTSATGILSYLLSFQGIKNYSSMVKPALAPPSIVFMIVWPILYILMGISAYIVDEKGGKEQLRPFHIQLLLNFLWSPVFFTLKKCTLAVVIIILLVFCVIWMIKAFSKVSKKAAALQIPYLLWLIFATYLNISICILN